jgi:molybdenum cofactor cytidylyltransferase
MADAGTCALAVLAAGGSSRMGEAKQLLNVGQEPLIRRVVASALDAGMDPTLVVLGARAEEIRPLLRDLPARLIDNPRWREGISSSLRAAVEALDGWPGARGVIVTLGDQPGMTAAHLRNGEACQRASGRSIVASNYGDHLGPPAYFDRRHFPALRTLRGDVGARALLHGEDAVSIAAPPGEGIDLDTPADYQSFRSPS